MPCISPCLVRYAHATRPQQDDIQVISTRVPFVPDDVGDTPQNATLLGRLPATVSGIIGYNGDVDVFSFYALSGTRVSIQLSLLAAYSSYGRTWERSNLDAEVTIMDVDTKTVAIWGNPNGLLSGSFTSEKLERSVSSTYTSR